MVIKNEETKTLQKCIKNLGFTPNMHYLSFFYRKIHCFKKEERALILAHVIHETAGFTKLEEENKNINDYDDLNIGKSFHGRGFLHLTWASNYKIASEELGFGDKLLIYPEFVADNLDVASDTAIWYWKKNVINSKDFSSTTFMINPVECHEPDKRRAKRRYYYYLQVAKVLAVDNVLEEGDYGVTSEKCCNIC